jgi:hypothetical protein
MPLMIVAELALQVLCLIHALRTGRDRMWVYVVILLPAVGSLAYAICELLPELIGPRLPQDIAKAARRAIDRFAKQRANSNSARRRTITVAWRKPAWSEGIMPARSDTTGRCWSATTPTIRN